MIWRALNMSCSTVPASAGEPSSPIVRADATLRLLDVGRVPRTSRAPW